MNANEKKSPICLDRARKAPPKEETEVSGLSPDSGAKETTVTVSLYAPSSANQTRS